MTLIDEYKKIMKREVPDEAFLVPMLVWTSGSEKNIENCQKVNTLFFYSNRKILIRELTFNNMCNHFVKYPKVAKDDDKLKFFFQDVCSFYGWTLRELKNNMNVLDFDFLKPRIAKAFGYDNKQRKLLGLEGLNNGKQHRKKSSKHSKKTTNDNKRDTRPIQSYF